MNSKVRNFRGNSILRLVLVGMSILFQLGWILLVILVLNEHYPWIELITRILSVLVILNLNSRSSAPAYKMPWIMLIMAAPVMGLSLYLMIGVFGDLGSTGKRMTAERNRIRRNLTGEVTSGQDLPLAAYPGAGISNYLRQHGNSPLYRNTAVTYHAQPSAALEQMKADLEAAEHFIFMEYFIVSGDSAFQEIAQILIRKARQGLDVRFMYDDVGSVGSANLIFAKRLKDAGIRCMVFNPVMPLLNLFMNHRDHRKITVIDGKIGYTGGYNLSDEYFGRKITYGQWKDTGIRLEGEAVRSLTAACLEMWNACSRTEGDCPDYLAVRHCVPGQAGFVQPYEDNPTGRERMAENVYLDLIYGAKETLYVMTPYLIITDEMSNAMTQAAKRGVDVRIITPGIPDKRIVYAITRSYYGGLAAQGVRIFEYTPGFCHGKMMLCDGKTASIGTSNLDFRSLYLHFENNVLLFGGEAVDAMAEDFAQIFPQCREVTERYRETGSRTMRLWQYILRLFAPLL